MINVVIPVDFERSVFWCLKHIFRIAKSRTSKCQFFLSINTRKKISYKVLKGLFGIINKNINFIECSYSGPVNRSKLRNFALERVSNRVLLMDLDLKIPDEKVIKWLEEENPNFAMFACLYENQKSENINPKTVRELRKKYSHIAIPSSVVYINKINIRFDESYIGHGYEDFDFIIRHLLSVKLIEPTSDLLKDETYESIFQLSGFRLVLTKFAIETLVKGFIFEHIHHKKGDKNKYKKERIRNAAIFREKFTYLEQFPKQSDCIFDIIERFGIDLHSKVGKLLLI